MTEAEAFYKAILNALNTPGVAAAIVGLEEGGGLIASAILEEDRYDSDRWLPEADDD